MFFNDKQNAGSGHQTLDTILCLSGHLRSRTTAR